MNQPITAIASGGRSTARVVHRPDQDTTIGSELASACLRLGYRWEWVFERSESGNLLRGGGRAQARRRLLLEILRPAQPRPGMLDFSAHEAAAACGMGPSSVLQMVWSHDERSAA